MAASSRKNEFAGGANAEQFKNDLALGKVRTMGAGGTWTTGPADVNYQVKNVTGNTNPRIRRFGQKNG